MPKQNPKRNSAASRYYKRSKTTKAHEYKDRAPIYFGLLFVGIIAAVFVVAGVLNYDFSGAVRVKKGDIVNIEYTGTLDNGTIFDSGELTDIEIGDNSLLDYFDQELVGVVAGERTSFTVPAEYGYTDPGHDLYGENLNFRIKIVHVIRDGKTIYPKD
ncbi:MAG: FKBP-type peptidyl-prolyl cis-trans isomerase [Promethearchaeota archaeon]